jgi:spore germination protein
MTLPAETPLRVQKRPRSGRGIWSALLVLLLLALVPAGFWAGRWVTSRGLPLAVWDPIVLRAYQDRPLDISAPGEGFWVAAYHVDYARESYDTLVQRASILDQVIVFGFGFERDGTLTGKQENIFRVRGITSAAKRVLLFANLNDAGFDRETAHAILTDPVVQQRALAGIVTKAREFGVAGVQIDFEYVPKEERLALTEFMARLRALCREHGWTLSMAVPVKVRDDPENDWSGAFDYPALGAIVDYLYLMAYDEHWSGGPPGPVASLPFTRRVIQYAVGVVPAQKLVLGVPFYGYEWTAGAARARAYGGERMATRMLENNAQIKWDPIMGEILARYTDQDGAERIAWFPDQRSLEAKIELAQTYNMKGIAAWRLGFESDDWWVPLHLAQVRPR